MGKLALLVLLLLLLGALWAVAVLTRYAIVRYLQYRLSDMQRYYLFLFHGVASLLTALIIPNNFLNQYPFFRELYERNGIWIPVSMLVVFFVAVIAIGILLSILMAAVSKVVDIQYTAEEIQEEAEVNAIEDQMYTTLFPGGQEQVDAEVEELIHFEFSGSYSPKLVKSVYVYASILFFLLEDKSEEKLLKSILTESGYQITLADAKKMHNYLYRKTLRQITGIPDEEFAQLDDTQELIGCDLDQIPGGIGEFGLDKTNPVPVKGIVFCDFYLDRLRTPDGKPINWEPTGSSLIPNLKKPVYAYRIRTTTGKEAAVIHVSPYHKRISNKAPKGFTLHSSSAGKTAPAAAHRA